jgi:hypothetical protein
MILRLQKKVSMTSKYRYRYNEEEHLATEATSRIDTLPPPKEKQWN